MGKLAGDMICGFTDLTIVLLGKAGSPFSFAIATQSSQAAGAPKSAAAGGGASCALRG